MALAKCLTSLLFLVFKYDQIYKLWTMTKMTILLINIYIYYD